MYFSASVSNARSQFGFITSEAHQTENSNPLLPESDTCELPDYPRRCVPVIARFRRSPRSSTLRSLAPLSLIIFAAACLSALALARRHLLGAIPAEPLNRKGHKGCNCRGELEPIFRSGLTQTGSKATSNWIGACKSKVKPKVLESVV